MSSRVAGCLTGPCVSANLGVGDLLEGHLFAYGVGSNISIVDVNRSFFSFQLSTFLFSSILLKTCVHSVADMAKSQSQPSLGSLSDSLLRNHAYLRHPDCHSRDLRLSTHLKSVFILIRILAHSWKDCKWRWRRTCCRLGRSSQFSPSKIRRYKKRI